MSKLTVEQLEYKLAQAYQVIGQLLSDEQFVSDTGQGVLDYFGSDVFDEDFLPWPKNDSEIKEKD